MASFVSGSCRYLAWEDAKRSANETNNNAIILEDRHVPCSLSVTSSHKTLAFYARKSRGLYCQLVLCGIGFLFPKFGSNKKACHFVTPRQKREIAYTVSLKHDLNFANILNICLKVSERNQNLAGLDAILRNFPAQNKHRAAIPKLSRESSSTFWPFRNS